MSEEASKSWSRARLPNIGVAVSRFPLAIALAALLTIYKLFHDDIGDTELRVMGWLAASFLWSVAVDFYAESQGRSSAIRAMLSLIGVALLALLFWLTWDIWLSPPFLAAGLLLLVGLAGHLGRGESSASFWLFNHRLWLGAVLALVGAVLLGAGLAIIHETLKLLFGIDLSTPRHNYYAYIWTISLAFIAPVSFLAFAPRSYTDPITAREEGDFTMRAIAALVKFVLVPLLLVYTAILYAYAVKIALAWELPKGTLGYMVMGYLLVGAATLLLGYPSRETGGPHVRFFWRYWVWLTALPVLLLFIAATRRIADYGLTEQRYLVILVGVWALILAALRLWRGGDFDLRIVPGVLALLLLAASFGPGGAIGFSVMSQKAELASILTEKGMLVDGKIVPQPIDSKTEGPLGSDAGRVRGIEWYLNTHRALGVLEPWFADLPNNPFAEGKTPEQTAREVLAAFGLTSYGPASATVLNSYADSPAGLSIEASSFLVGPVQFQRIGGERPETLSQSVEVEGLGDITVELANSLLTVSLASGESVQFNVVDAAKKVHTGLPIGPKPAQQPLPIEGSGNRLAGTAFVSNLNAIFSETELDISILDVWLVLRRAP
jgi:hypothetical protein